jgi:hypothetical protein
MVRKDYGGLVNLTRNSEMRKLLLDNESMLITANAFVFAARGADTSSLGLKVGERRPDLIILDDIEPDEGKYSLASVRKRRNTVNDAILPLNEFARVMWVGTTTRNGGLAHQLVEYANGVLDLTDPDHFWVTEQRFQSRRWDPVIATDDGGERSLWPAKWSMTYLNSVRGTRAYAKNMANEPMAEDGEYWSTEDIQHLYSGYDHMTLEEALVRKQILVLDPDVNDLHQSSDWTGVCVAGMGDKRVLVRELTQVVMADFPKPVRASMALNHYQARPTRVVHEVAFRAGEAQMCAFPNVTHDDMVDVVSWAVRYLLEPDTIRRPKGFVLKRRSTVEVTSYV